MSKKILAKLQNIQVLALREGDTFMCFSPALDLVSHGDTFEDALDSFRSTLTLFSQEVTRMGTWDKVLSDCGWIKVGKTFEPPMVIGRSMTEMAIPA